MSLAFVSCLIKVINLADLALSLALVSLAQGLSLTLAIEFVTWSFESFLSRSQYL